jgi:hypothetical protein
MNSAVRLESVVCMLHWLLAFCVTFRLQIHFTSILLAYKRLFELKQERQLMRLFWFFDLAMQSLVSDIPKYYLLILFLSTLMALDGVQEK